MSEKAGDQWISKNILVIYIIDTVNFVDTSFECYYIYSYRRAADQPWEHSYTPTDNRWSLISIKKEEDIEIIFSRGSRSIYYYKFKGSTNFKKMDIYTQEPNDDEFRSQPWKPDIAFNRSIGKINSVYE